MGNVRVEEEKAILHVARDNVIDIVRPWTRKSTGGCHMGSATRRQERCDYHLPKALGAAALFGYGLRGRRSCALRRLVLSSDMSTIQYRARYGVEIGHRIDISEFKSLALR